jgi:2'-5' RNA ligase
MQHAFAFHRKARAGLFFCVRPDAETSLLIDERRRLFLRRTCLDGRLRDKALLHITLHGAGEYEEPPKPVVAAARRAAAAISMRSFQVTLHAIRSFPRRGRRMHTRNMPLVLLAESDLLHVLHGRLGTGMSGSGFRVDRHFTPHMTLHYCSREMPLRAIDPITFPVREFFFVHSEWGLSRHTVIESWPLEGDPAAGGGTPAGLPILPFTGQSS